MKKLYCMLLVLLLSGLSWAIVEYGQLAGTVTDSKGGALPGATVTILSDAMIGGARTMLTDAKGDFIFIQLRPGDYTVTCTMEGFQSVKNEKVEVKLDRTAKLIVKLQDAKEFKETVVVTGQAPVVDPTQTNTGDVFDQTYLQETAIGSGGRSYQSVLTQSGGVTGGGNPQVLGSDEGSNNYLVDGLSTTDPVTATFGTNFNFDAIQEISFQTGGFEAEYGQATGGIVNVVTKSGSNRFEGSFDIRYSNEHFYEGSDKYPPWDHYDPSIDTTSFYNPSFVLGGPILKDKVWFFVSLQDTQSKTTPAGLNYTYHWDGQDYLGKITWQISPNDTLIAKYSDDEAKIHNADAGYGVTKEAASRQDQFATIYQGDYSRILSESLLFTAKVGINKQPLNAYPESGDFNTPPSYDIDHYLLSQNASNVQYSKRNRTEGLFSLTWFKNNLAGDHTFKVGADYNDLKFDWNSYTPGDRIYYTYDFDKDGVPDPYFKYVYQRLPQTQDKGKSWNVFLQDEWKILPNLVFKPGIRYDKVDYWNDVGTKVASLNKWQPRIGVAWDILNDATTVARAYYGIFMHPSSLTLPDTLRHSSTSWSQWYSADYEGWKYGMTAQEYCETFGGCDSEGYVDINDYSLEPPQAAKNLKATYARQLSVGFERQILPRTGLSLDYVQKKTFDIMEDSCYGYDANGNAYDPINFISNPDSYDFNTMCQFYLLRNNPFAKRYYFGYILKFESRYKDWFHILFDYTYSKAYESVGYNADYGYASTAFDLPLHYLNTYGYAGADNRHYVKLNGYFYLPDNFTIGINSFFRTGRPYTKYADKYSVDYDGPCESDGTGCTYYAPPMYGTYYLEKQGSERLPSIWWIDFQLTYGIKISQGVQAKIIGSINNLTNNQAVLARCSHWNSTNPNDPNGGVDSCPFAYYDRNGVLQFSSLSFGQAEAWQSPRSYEVGFRLEF